MLLRNRKNMLVDGTWQCSKIVDGDKQFKAGKFGFLSFKQM